MEAGGAPPEDNATAWDDYRKAALFCLVYPVVAWRGMDAGDPRQVDLATTMLDRFDRAVEELDLAACCDPPDCLADLSRGTRPYAGAAATATRTHL